MNVTRNDWTPLLEGLKEKVSAQGRRKLLYQMIGDVYDITVLNFGYEGIARPSPWQELTFGYAQDKKGGNRTPNLILTGALKAGFVHQINSDSASLTNVVDYADEHQFGVEYKNLPARPFYPIDDEGNLTPFAEARQFDIIQEHFQV